MDIWMYIVTVPVIFVAYFLFKGMYQGAAYYDIDPQNMQDLRAIQGVAFVQKMIEEYDYSYEQVSKVLGAVDLCSTYINQPTLVATS